MPPTRTACYCALFFVKGDVRCSNLSFALKPIQLWSCSSMPQITGLLNISLIRPSHESLRCLLSISWREFFLSGFQHIYHLRLSSSINWCHQYHELVWWAGGYLDGPRLFELYCNRGWEVNIALGWHYTIVHWKCKPFLIFLSDKEENTFTKSVL